MDKPSRRNVSLTLMLFCKKIKLVNSVVLVTIMMLNTPFVFGQNEVFVFGEVINAKTNSAVDSSVFVSIKTENNLSFKSYCNNKGQYSINLPDTLNNVRILIQTFQDEGRMKQYVTTEPCSIKCFQDEAIYLSGNAERLVIRTDSTKQYLVNFKLIPAIFSFTIPTIYFKKNELIMIQSDKYLSVDSAICDIKNLMSCYPKFVFAVVGNCSSGERSKMELSFNRAKLVRDKLIAMGINPDRIIPVGNSDKSYKHNKSDVLKYRKLNGDSRPNHINKIDYEWQEVTISVLSRDFK